MLPSPRSTVAFLAVALGLAAGPAPVAGQPVEPPRQERPLYRWTDESGNTHVTDDPNQVPDAQRPKPPPPDPRSSARAAVESLRSIAALVTGEPAHDDYTQGVAQARRAVEQALGALERGGLRAALTEALRCYREAAELWDNQLHVRRGMDLALNMAPIRSAWECGAQKTAEAERLLAGRGAR